MNRPIVEIERDLIAHQDMGIVCVCSREYRELLAELSRARKEQSNGTPDSQPLK